MYNNVYQEYINNIIGSSTRNEINFGENSYNNIEYSSYFQHDNNNSEIEKFYPDLYKLIYPMVQAACTRNTKPITRECIEEMVEDIYSNFATDDDMSVLNINLTNDVRSKTTSEAKSTSKPASSSKTSAKDETDTRQVETRQRNRVLSDLIRILLIRELLGRPGNVFPRPPSRPPFPGPGPRPGRPPFRSDMNFDMQDYSIYEKPINMYSNLDAGYNIF